VYCGTAAAHSELVLDHVIPGSKGGWTDHTNLVTACQPCNSGKWDRYKEVRESRTGTLSFDAETMVQVAEGMREQMRRAQAIENYVKMVRLAYRVHIGNGWNLLSEGMIRRWAEEFGYDLDFLMGAMALFGRKETPDACNMGPTPGESHETVVERFKRFRISLADDVVDEVREPLHA
jgi:hypothetical protein